MTSSLVQASLRLTRANDPIDLSGRLRESNHRGSLSRRGPDKCTFWKKSFCMPFLSSDMCGFKLLQKSLRIFQVAQYIQRTNRPYYASSGLLKEVKTHGRKLHNRSTPKVIAVANERSSLIVEPWLENFKCFGPVVAYRSRSLTGGGRTRTYNRGKTKEEWKMYALWCHRHCKNVFVMLPSHVIPLKIAGHKHINWPAPALWQVPAFWQGLEKQTSKSVGKKR